MALDLIGAALVLLFAFLGWYRGFLLTALSLLGLFTGYVSAYFLYKPLGELLGGWFSLQPLLSYPVGGAAAFLLGVLALGVVRALVWRRRRRLRKQGIRPHILDRVGGAALGGVYGGTLVLLACWVLVLLRSVTLGTGEKGGWTSPIPDVREAAVGRVAVPLSERLAYRVAEGGTGNRTVAKTAARFAKDPLQTTRDLSRVLADNRVQSLLGDRAVMRQLARDPKQTALSNPTIRELARDPRFVKQVARLGLLSGAESGELPPEEVQRQLVKRLAPMAKLTGQLAQDPEVQKLLNDEELLGKLERRDMMALVNDPKFNRLAELVSQRLRAVSRSSAGE
jgi:uncharacterized membrane protein required for colicin V production